MRYRLYTQFAAVILLPVLGGCAQMTRHSNMMIFGTNTVVGIKAGVNAQSIPEVQIGFTRQEAVVLPLVANVGRSTKHFYNDKTKNTDGVIVTPVDSGRLDPCDLSAAIDVTKASGDARDFLVHPCSLVASNGKAMDSYSVLASFGGDFTTTHEQGKPAAKASIAQYFSTGIAAQLLALKGGAALVATGEAAKTSANEAVDGGSVRALFGEEPTAADMVQVKRGRAYPAFANALLAKFDEATDQSIGPSIIAFEKAAGLTTGLGSNCADVKSCRKLVKSDAYLNDYQNRAVEMEKALIDWK